MKHLPFVRVRPPVDEQTYYVYGINKVTTIKAYSFKIAHNGALVFTGIDGKILRVFAHSAWNEIIVDNGGLDESKR